MKLQTLWTGALLISGALADWDGYTDGELIDESYDSSPSFYPAPQGGRFSDYKWLSAYDRARDLVNDMTLVEKVNLTMGVGSGMGVCAGWTGSVPRLNITPKCLQDAPLGVRSADLVSVFPCGLATASTFNKQLFYDKHVAIGSEFKGKGIDVALGPVYGPMGVKAQGGRGWEGHGPDPYLEGIAAALGTVGLQSQGVVSCAKHLVGNEQEHYRFATDFEKRTMDYSHNVTESISVNIDDRSLHEIYLWPFAEAVKAGVTSVMCSYNRVNQSHACQNSYLLNYLLKEELGFQGFVVSDWNAVYSGVDSAIAGLDLDMPGEDNYFGSNLTMAALNGSLPIDRLDDMVTRFLAGLIYAGVHNPDGPNFHAGTFETYGQEFFGAKAGPVIELNQHVDVRSDFSRFVSLKTATEGIVLLKNENNTLPLSKEKYNRIALLGRAASDDEQGTYCHRFGCDTGAMGTGYGSGAGQFSYFVTPKDGIGARLTKEKISWEYVPDNWNQASAMTSAEYSDAAIIVGTSASGEETFSLLGNYGDPNNLTLWHNAEELIKNVTTVNNNTILVLTAGMQIDLEPFIDNENVTAVIYSSYLGQDFGTALAAVLFGDVNPSGRLPFTIAKDTSHYIPVVKNVTIDEPQDNLYEAGIYVDYRYYDKHDLDVRYEFGYGLSYSNFTLSDLSLSVVEEFSETIEDDVDDYLPVFEYEDTDLSAEEARVPSGFTKIKGWIYPYIASNDTVKKGNYTYPPGYSTKQLSKPISKAGGAPGGNPHLWDVGYVINVKTTNEGPYDGAFVPQLYVSFPDDDEFDTPPVQLRGFDKVDLGVGRSAWSTFEVTRKDLSVWDTTTQEWRVLRGEYKFYVGSSSRKLDLVETVTI